jgi:uncharacterized protein YaeQ
MAQRSTIHRIHVELSDTDRQVYEDLQMSVARADSETAHRLLARLLAYCLCYERDIEFTGGVGAGEEPDVWVKEPGDRVKVWIEVGLPDPKRLIKAARHCERVVLLAYGNRLPRWQAEAVPELEKHPNITVEALELRLLNQLEELLDRTIDWNLTVSGGTLYLASGKHQFESALAHVTGPPLLPG